MADFQRQAAYKLKIGDILQGSPILQDEKLASMLIRSKNIYRVNIIGNVIEKYASDGEKKFSSITLDDASGQIRLKVFGEDIQKFQNIAQGQTIVAIGILKMFNNEVYIAPEIVREISSEYLMVRKLELDQEAENQKPLKIDKHELVALRDTIMSMIKEAEDKGGLETEKIIMEIKQASPELIQQEIRKLIEEGMIFEPSPGKVRWLG
jgi:RPA family protein